MAPHSSTLAWKIPWMAEPGRLQSMGSLRVGHNWATELNWTNLKRFKNILFNFFLGILLSDYLYQWQILRYYFLNKYMVIMEKAMATHSSTLAWKIPWMAEPGRLQFMGSLRVGHDWVPSLALFTFMHWRRKWQPTPVFLPGESQGQGSLVSCRLWGRTESDMTEATLAAAAAFLMSLHFQIYPNWRVKPSIY